MRFRTLLPTFLLAGAVALSYGSFIQHFSKPLGFDWTYFEGLALVIRSSILHYHVLPLHNPWVCGGLDILANPQSFVFSPLLPLHLLMGPRAAYIAGLMVWGVFGILGMFLLLRRLSISTWLSVVGSALFINATFFKLHFQEGHTVFGSMQALPWVALCVLRLRERFFQLLLVAVLAVFLLDGGVYAFIFSFLLAATVVICMLPRWHAHHLVEAWRALPQAALLGITTMLLAAPKLVPVLAAISTRSAVLDNNSLSGELLLHAFFNPVQILGHEAGKGQPYSFHEFGCYLGVPVVVLAVALLASPGAARRHAPWVVAGMFFFWVGSGWGGEFNPWIIFQRLPLINNAHVQSRLFILTYLCVVVLAVAALQMLHHRKVVLGLLCTLLLVESFYVTNNTLWALDQGKNQHASRKDLITSTTIKETVPYGNGTGHYLGINRGSATCYEPAQPGTAVQASNTPGHRGEAYVLEGQGHAELLGYTPGRIRLRVEMETAGAVALNTNALWGWRSHHPDVKVRAGLAPYKLLVVEVPQGPLEVMLTYEPHYFLPMVALWLMGWVLFAGLIIHAARRRGI